jgi:hypothetical protein
MEGRKGRREGSGGKRRRKSKDPNLVAPVIQTLKRL